MGYYPIMLDLSGKKCLIVGGGEVALRKAQSLLDAGANVYVVAPNIISKFESLNKITISKRKYEPDDMCGCSLVFAATNDKNLNSQIYDEAKKRNIFVNVVDSPTLCEFIVPSIIRRGDLIIAASTSGKFPFLSKKIRQDLELIYVKEYQIYLDILSRMRSEIKEKYKNKSKQNAAFERLLDCGILELLKNNKIDEAIKRAEQCI